MASPYEQPARGIRKSSAIVNTVAAPAVGTAVTLYQRTTGGQNPRTVILRKLMAWNNTGADAILEIGQDGIDGVVAFANIIPPVLVLNGFDGEWHEDELPEVEIGNDLTMECNQDGVQVQVEVEEIE